MSAVRPLDTGPEMLVRRRLTSLGIRYRLHRYDLPGRPDIVMSSRRRVIFVHGCYWHRHPGCHKATMPARNERLWRDKFEKTVARDKLKRKALRAAGWQVLVVWECDVRNEPKLTRLLQRFLAPSE
jgi:DNA mismatch endonuclease (patch repair protein)